MPEFFLCSSDPEYFFISSVEDLVTSLFFWYLALPACARVPSACSLLFLPEAWAFFRSFLNNATDNSSYYILLFYSSMIDLEVWSASLPV